MYKSNISESLQFLVFCREALAQIIDASSMSNTNKDHTKNFLFNEASDYQIMSLVVRGELPKVKFNVVDEITLFEELKGQMLLSADLLSEIMSVDDMCQFICEVDTVYPVGASSAKPILEFLNENSSMAVLTEEPLTPTDIVRWTRTLSKGVADKIDNAPEAARRALQTAAQNFDNKRDAIVAAGKEMAKRGKIGWAKFAQDTDPALNRMRAQKGNLGAGIKDLGASQKSSIQQSIKRAGEEYQNRPMSQKATDSVTAFINRMKFKYPSATQAVQDIMTKAQEFSKTGEAKAIAAAALVALISYASYKVYKAKLSKAARACKGQKGDAKNACMNNYRKQALMAQIQDMKKASSGCIKTKDPNKCKDAIQRKIQKLTARATKF